MIRLITYFILVGMTFGASAQSTPAEVCRLGLGESSRAHIVLAYGQATAKVDLMLELTALAAYLEKPIPDENITLPVLEVEAKVAGLKPEQLEARLQKLSSAITALRATNPGQAQIPVYRLRNLGATLRAVLVSATATRALENFLNSDQGSRAKHAYLASIKTLLAARFKTHGQAVEEWIVSLVDET